jgi:hypothetical protein
METKGKVIKVLLEKPHPKPLVLFCFVLSSLSFKPHPKIHVTKEHAY